MKRPKFKFLILSVILILLLIVGGLFSYTKFTRKNVTNALDSGIEYLLKDDYEKALNKFNNVLSIDDKNEKGKELKEFTDELMKAEKYYKNYQYDEALNIIDKLNKKSYSDDLINILIKYKKKIKDKLSINEELDNLSDKIKVFVN